MREIWGKVLCHAGQYLKIDLLKFPDNGYIMPDNVIAATTPGPAAAAAAGSLFARAEALQPVLRARAAAAEAARRVPVESVTDFREAGLTRMTQPERFGGQAMGWDVLCGVSQRLTRGDGAQGWVQAIMADHAQMLGTFPLEAQEDVWGENPDAVMSASFDPKGIATPVEGGYSFSGRFGFASGIDHADWLICAGFIVVDDKRDGSETRDGPHFFLLRRSDATIIDDWHTIGLEGTGSKSFEVKDVFVPGYAILRGEDARTGNGPGAAVNPGGVYRLPRGFLTPALFASMTVGMAQGLLDQWLTYTATRKSRGTKVADNPTSHMIAGECAAEIDAAEALNRDTITAAMMVLDAGGTLSDGELLRAKRNSSWACRTALNAGTRLFNTAGGTAIFKGGPVEREYRNLLASAAHHIVNWEVSALDSGAAMLRGASGDISEGAA
jgi:alkylation response protein AidB-like acyl-CoA dehydrogenase